MDILVLKRISTTPDGTPGVLIGPDDWPCGVTLEPQKPIITDGIYWCSPFFSQSKQRNCFLINDVIGHTAVQVHVGNYDEDTDGCVLVADSFGTFDEPQMIENSKMVFNKLWELYGKTGFRLSVKS